MDFLFKFKNPTLFLGGKKRTTTVTSEKGKSSNSGKKAGKSQIENKEILEVLPPAELVVAVSAPIPIPLTPERKEAIARSKKSILLIGGPPEGRPVAVVTGVPISSPLPEEVKELVARRPIFFIGTTPPERRPVAVVTALFNSPSPFVIKTAEATSSAQQPKLVAAPPPAADKGIATSSGTADATFPGPFSGRNLRRCTSYTRNLNEIFELEEAPIFIPEEKQLSDDAPGGSKGETGNSQEGNIVENPNKDSNNNPNNHPNEGGSHGQQVKEAKNESEDSDDSFDEDELNLNEMVELEGLRSPFGLEYFATLETIQEDDEDEEVGEWL